MRGLIFSCLVLLAGCSTTTPGIKVQTVEVPTIIIQKCIKKEDIPQRPSGLGEMPSNVQDVARVALQKLVEWTKYGNQTSPLLELCSQ